MGKESREGRRPNLVEQTIERLEAQNAEVGNQLCSLYGRGDKKALVFLTSVAKNTESVKKGDLLVITQYGAKLLRFDGSKPEISSIIRTMIKSRSEQGKKSHFLDNSGYYRREEILALGRCVYITPNET